MTRPHPMTRAAVIVGVVIRVAVDATNHMTYGLIN